MHTRAREAVIVHVVCRQVSKDDAKARKRATVALHNTDMSVLEAERAAHQVRTHLGLTVTFVYLMCV